MVVRNQVWALSPDSAGRRGGAARARTTHADYSSVRHAAARPKYSSACPAAAKPVPLREAREAREEASRACRAESKPCRSASHNWLPQPHCHGDHDEPALARLAATGPPRSARSPPDRALRRGAQEARHRGEAHRGARARRELAVSQVTAWTRPCPWRRHFAREPSVEAREHPQQTGSGPAAAASISAGRTGPRSRPSSASGRTSSSRRTCSGRSARGSGSRELARAPR